MGTNNGGIMEKIYILRQDLYNEWAIENGATNLITATPNIKNLIEKLKKYCLYELEEDGERIIEDLDLKLDDIIERVKNNLERGSNLEKISIYENKRDYDNGIDNAVFVIEKIDIEL